MEEKLELKLNEVQIAHMKVGSQIVEHLSKGIYDNPSNSIKELINNSYDADASKVTIRAKPEFDTFTIIDDGCGMNFKDFQNKFLVISRSDKRDNDILSPIFKRPLIGFIGIGFIAVSQICNKMTVISSKTNEEYKFEAIIDFSKFKKTEHKKKDFYDLSEVKFKNLSETKEAHYTIIILNELTKEFKDYLIDKDRKEALEIKSFSFTGLSFEGIIERINYNIRDHKFDISKDLGQYWKLLLDLSISLPIPYLNDGPIRFDNSILEENVENEGALDILQQIKSNVINLNFEVDFDGVILKKPILLPNEEEIQKLNSDFNVFPISKKFIFDDKSELEFFGYIYNQRRMIYPPQFRGLIVRIKNVSIGGPVPDFLEYLYGEKQFLNWTFGEVYIKQGLESSMNIDRSSFVITNEHYQCLRNYIHDLLHEEIIPKCRDRYEVKKTKEKQEEKQKNILDKKEYLKSVLNHDFEIIDLKKSSKNAIDVDLKEKIVRIYSKHLLYSGMSSNEKELLKTILLILEVSYNQSKGNSKLMKELFLKGVEEFKKWRNH